MARKSKAATPVANATTNALAMFKVVAKPAVKRTHAGEAIKPAAEHAAQAMMSKQPQPAPSPALSLATLDMFESELADQGVSSVSAAVDAAAPENALNDQTRVRRNGKQRQKQKTAGKEEEEEEEQEEDQQGQKVLQDLQEWSISLSSEATPRSSLGGSSPLDAHRIPEGAGLDTAFAELHASHARLDTALEGLQLSQATTGNCRKCLVPLDVEKCQVKGKVKKPVMVCNCCNRAGVMLARHLTWPSSEFMRLDEEHQVQFWQLKLKLMPEGMPLACHMASCVAPSRLLSPEGVS
jgi:hypothetical protein